MLIVWVICQHIHIWDTYGKKSVFLYINGYNNMCLSYICYIRSILDTPDEPDIFLNSELFLPKGVSFVVSKYKFPPCVSQVIKLHANTIRLQLNVGPVSYQIKDI